MKKCGKRIVVGLMSMLMVLSLAGCNTEQSSVSSNSVNQPLSAQDPYYQQVYISIEDMDVTMEDIYLYVLLYLYNNGVDAATLDGMKETEIINRSIDQIKLEYVQYKLALVSEVTIDDAQKAEATTTAEGFVSYFGEDFLAKYGVQKETVEEMFLRQVYIENLRLKSLMDLKNDYMEQYEEEFQDMEFFSMYYVLFPIMKYDENQQPVVDEAGQQVAMTEAEKQEQYARAVECAERAQANALEGNASGQLEELAVEYGVDAFAAVERNYVGAYIEELDNLVEGMENGDISDVVETQAGYMVVRMDNRRDEEYKAYMIDSVASQSAEALFPSLQENWMSGSGAINLMGDPTLLMTIDVGSICQDMNEHGYSLSGAPAQ